MLFRGHAATHAVAIATQQMLCIIMFCNQYVNKLLSLLLLMRYRADLSTMSAINLQIFKETLGFTLYGIDTSRETVRSNSLFLILTQNCNVYAYRRANN